MKNPLSMGKPSVSISGENFAFDKSSLVIESSNTATVIEPGFDETSSKIEWKIYKRDVYFHLNPDKFEPISPKPVNCDIFVYKDANNKFKLAASRI